MLYEVITRAIPGPNATPRPFSKAPSSTIDRGSDVPGPFIGPITGRWGIDLRQEAVDRLGGFRLDERRDMPDAFDRHLVEPRVLRRHALEGLRQQHVARPAADRQDRQFPKRLEP